MIVVTYLLRQSITLYKNLGGGLEPLSPIAGAATADDHGKFEQYPLPDRKPTKVAQYGCELWIA